MKPNAASTLAGMLLAALPLRAAPPSSPAAGTALAGDLLVLRNAGHGLASRPDYGFHGIFITGGAILRLGDHAKRGATRYNIANDIEVDHGAIECMAGNPHFTGRVSIGPGGATFITISPGQDMYFDSDVSGAGPLRIDNDASGAGGVVRFTNDLSLIGTVAVNGPSPGFSGGRILLGDADALNQAILVPLAGMRGVDFDPAIKVFSLGGLAGDGDIDLKGKTVRVGIVSKNTLYAGSIGDSIGDGALVHSGTGTLTLTGQQGSGAHFSVFIGTLVVNGTVETEIKVGNPGIPLARAVLSGTGSLGDVLLQTPGAVVQPGEAGNAAGILKVRNFSMIPGSNLSIRLGGAAPGLHGYDQVQASGQFSLYGNIEVTLAPGYRPKPGAAWYIMVTSSRAPTLGHFCNLLSDEIAVAGHRFRINYTADSAKNDPGSTSGHDIALTLW